MNPITDIKTNGAASSGAVEIEQYTQVQDPFEEWVKKIAVSGDRPLPFSVKFFENPVRDFYGHFPKTIIGNPEYPFVEIPTFNDISQQEKWFFSHVSSLETHGISLDRHKLRDLAEKLIAECPDHVHNITEALAKIYDGSVPEGDPIKKDPKYKEFQARYAGEILELLTAQSLTTNKIVYLTMRVAFFLKSRVGQQWTTDRIGMLPSQAVEQIDKLIQLETNKGIDIDAIEYESEDENKALEESEGK